MNNLTFADYSIMGLGAFIVAGLFVLLVFVIYDKIHKIKKPGRKNGDERLSN